MSEQSNTLQNENIDVTFERKPNSVVHFKVHVKPPASKAAKDKAIKNVTKEVSLPGFRKGKAPQALIVQHYSKHVDNEFRDILIQTGFYEAVQLTKISPYDRNDMRLKIQKFNLAQDNSADMEFEFESYPTIPEVNLETLEVPKIEVKDVTPSDVDDVLNNIRLQFADWQLEKERPVVEDDYVLLEITTPEGKKLTEKNRLHLKDPSFPENLKKEIVGMKPGESKEVTPAADDEWIKNPYKIILEAIEIPVLPPIDDELAKKTGVANVEELRKSIDNQLVQRRKQSAVDHQRHHMREFLIQNYKFDLPGKVVENVTGRMNNSGEDPDHNMADYLVDQAKLAFLIHKLSRDNNISLTDEELRFGTMRLWLNHVSQHGEDNSQETLKRIQESAPNTLLSQKVLDFLISKATLTDACTDEHHQH